MQMHQKSILGKVFLCVVLGIIFFNGSLVIAQTEFAVYDNLGDYQTTKDSYVGPSRGYDVYRPASLGANGELHPIITWGNGTGAFTELYGRLLKHLASYGFIVIASNSTQVGSGREMINGISWLLEQNTVSSSIYYNKINPASIGATGHSQGGAGTINTAQKDSRVTSIAPLAPATFTAPFFYSTAGIDCPIFIMVGANDALANPLLVYSTSYLSAETTAIYGKLSWATHMSFAGDAGNFKKYITAWFVATLWKDANAENLFFIPEGALYQDRSWSRVESKYLDQYVIAKGYDDKPAVVNLRTAADYSPITMSKEPDIEKDFSLTTTNEPTLPASVPEPTTLMLFCTGVLVLVGLKRRFKK